MRILSQGSILKKFYECFSMSLDSYLMKFHKNQFYKFFHDSWLLKTNPIEILYESWLVFHKSANQAKVAMPLLVIFSIFM